MLTAYIDESIRGRYYACAVVVLGGDAARMRGEMLRLRARGERRVHMAKEGRRRRLQIVRAVNGLGCRAYLYESEIAGRSLRVARDDCLRAIVEDLTAEGVDRIVIESCDQDKQDKIVIREALRKCRSELHYEHLPPHAEPLLWLPDVVAWAFGAGGTWQARIKSVVARHRHV